MLLAIIAGLLVYVVLRSFRKALTRSVSPAPPIYSDNIIPFRRKGMGQ